MPPVSNHFSVSFELSSCTEVIKPALEAYCTVDCTTLDWKHSAPRIEADCICDYEKTNELMTMQPLEPYSNVDVPCALRYEWLRNWLIPTLLFAQKATAPALGFI